MKTTLTTKDKIKLTLFTLRELSDLEKDQMRSMEFRRLFHVGALRGFRVEE